MKCIALKLLELCALFFRKFTVFVPKRNEYSNLQLKTCLIDIWNNNQISAAFFFSCSFSSGWFVASIGLQYCCSAREKKQQYRSGKKSKKESDNRMYAPNAFPNGNFCSTILQFSPGKLFNAAAVTWIQLYGFPYFCLRALCIAWIQCNVFIYFANSHHSMAIPFAGWWLQSGKHHNSDIDHLISQWGQRAVQLSIQQPIQCDERKNVITNQTKNTSQKRKKIFSFFLCVCTPGQHLHHVVGGKYVYSIGPFTNVYSVFISCIKQIQVCAVIKYSIGQSINVGNSLKFKMEFNLIVNLRFECIHENQFWHWVPNTIVCFDDFSIFLFL